MTCFRHLIVIAAFGESPHSPAPLSEGGEGGLRVFATQFITPGRDAPLRRAKRLSQLVSLRRERPRCEKLPASRPGWQPVRALQPPRASWLRSRRAAAAAAPSARRVSRCTSRCREALAARAEP